MNARRLNDWLLLGGLFGLLILAFLLDILRNAMLNNATSSLSVGEQQRLFFLLPLLQLLLMLAMLGLVWAFLSSAGYSRWVTIVYLLVGLLLLYAMGLLSALPFPDSVYVVVLYLSPDSYLFQAGGAAAALGLIGLFFWKAVPAQVADAELPS